jgi:isocitrate lyase
LLWRPGVVLVAGAHDALSAKLAEEAGFDAVWASGFGISAVQAVPDANILTLTETLEAVRRICDAVTIPVVADCDNGYGNAINVMRTVREYIQTGVAGIHIEDQVFPKRCGHIAGKTIIPLEAAVGKYRAAIDTRNQLNPDFVIIARTDAYGAVGGSLEEAIRRGRAYADAGVDLVWPELSSPDREPAVAFAKAMRQSHPNLPLAFNYSSSFKWHKDPNPFTFRELGELGYKFIFITIFAAHAGMYAVWNAMEELVKDEEQAQWRLEKTKVGHPTESHHVMARVSHFQELEKRYIPGSDERIKGSAGYDDSRMH